MKILLLLSALFLSAPSFATNLTCKQLLEATSYIMTARQNDADKQLVIQAAISDGYKLLIPVINDAYRYPVAANTADKKVFVDLFSRIYFTSCVASNGNAI